MLNFKKAGIFSRGTVQEDACEQEEQCGGVLAVWGSPGSGKTTVAVRLAKYLADKRRNVILLLCDMTAPMLPCICPVSDLECERSLGSVLAAAHVSENLVKNNLVTHKRLGYLTMLGMFKGENEYTYPAIFTAAFSAGAGASAGSIGYGEEVSPTLKGTASGNCMPSILCLNDQGGSAIACSENVAGTLRAQEHGHQPLVFENHGIDARYTGPHSVAPTMSARYGTGGNNVPLVAEPDTIFCITGNAIDRQPMNGGNGIGYQQGIAYTLTATDHHAVFSRQRVDVFKSNEVVSTQSAHQHKDATDLVVDMDEPDNSASAPRGASVLLIRRLTPLECERLQGFPDGWTDIEGASDSARYKALGNSVAIPCVDYVLQGIAWATTAQTA